MKCNKILLLLIGYLAVHSVNGQSEADYFNQAAKQYVNEDIPATGQILAEGLDKYPQDPKLNALLEKLKKDQEEQDKKDQENQEQQKQDQEEQNQEEQQQQDQESQEQEKGEGEEQTEEDGADESDQMEEKRGEESQEENENPGELDSDLSDREKAMEELRQRLEEMNITPEQAAQILDAMNSNELQYIQQNRKKPTQQPKRGLPDW
ncbi:MAG: hypothetical protein WD398_05825 [Cyclobacteriaceae bacterium]